MLSQVQEDYLVKDHRMVSYLEEVKVLSEKIRDLKICQIPWEENRKVDTLANLTSAFNFISNRSIPLELLPNPSIEFTKTICQAKAGLTWMYDIMIYLQYGTLPLDKL